MTEEKFANVEEALETLLPERVPVPVEPSAVRVIPEDWPLGSELASSLLREIDRQISQAEI